MGLKTMEWGVPSNTSEEDITMMIDAFFEEDALE